MVPGPDSEEIVASAVRFVVGEVECATPFDHRYDLLDDEALYCSELVWLAYQEAGVEWDPEVMSNLALTPVEGPVVLPSGFLFSKQFETVCTVSAPERHRR